MVPKRRPLPVRVGEYELFGLIGTGGMASVYIGTKRTSDGPSRVVAVKRLHPHLLSDPLVVTSFHDEARIASMIRHPNVVELLEVVSEGGELSLVMEYVEGESLAKLLALARQESKLPPFNVSVAIVVGVLRGLHAAHEAKGGDGQGLSVVHRDVTPENIIVREDGTPKLADFGVAKALGRLQTTREGGLKGKCSYMAPEQIRGVGVTRKTDIFAAGAVLFELLTGSRLFDGDDEAAILSKALFDPVPHARDKNPAVPEALEAVLENALDRDPTGRFHSADEMAEALEEALPPASDAAVADWLQGVARGELASRRQARDDALLTPPAFEHSVAPVGPHRGSARRVLPAMLIAAALGAGVYGVALRGKMQTETAGRSPPPNAVSSPEVPTPAAVASPPLESPPAPVLTPTAEPPRRPPSRDARPKRAAPAPSGKPLYSRD